MNSKRSSVPNPAQLPTPINVNRLTTFLEGYPSSKKAPLISGLTWGFRICSTLSSRPSSSYTNHRSALQNQAIVMDKLAQEIKLDRIAGPFLQTPLIDFISSPLGLVPKKSSSEFRLIHDLSFPRSDSVNSHIDPTHTAVQYEDLDHCISIINSLGQNSLIAKTDLKDAFRILPVHPNDYRLLGFTWKGLYYYDKCLPMGCSISCKVFESLSVALQWILQSKLQVLHMSHILDDFIFFGPPSSQECHRYLTSFLTLANSLNLPIKHNKTVQPTTNIILHGIEVDTTTMSIRLPQDKLQEARDKVNSLRKKKTTTLVNLQSLLGTLNFACRVVSPGRAFLRRLHDLTKNTFNKSHHIRLTKASRLDLQAWNTFLTDFNGQVMCLPTDWTPSTSLKLFTDASAAGYAGVLGSHWIQGLFPSKWKDTNIAVKELLPIVLSVRLWGPSLTNKRIIFFCDNLAIVAVINKQTSKNSSIMALLRSLVVVCLKYNIMFTAKHIPGKRNIIADLLSRSQISSAQEIAPQLDKEPQQIPAEWLPW